MFRNACKCVFVLIITVVMCSPAWAAGRQGRQGRMRKVPATSTNPQNRLNYPAAHNGRNPAFPVPGDIYPQFYGGFHYRTLYDYGHVRGELGFRGSPW